MVTFILFPFGVVVGIALGWKVAKLTRPRAKATPNPLRPVPLAVRTPSAADCDEGGQCWFGEAGGVVWELREANRRLSFHTCWLGRWDLPLPVDKKGRE
jgi:hypothetical protein